MPSYFEPEPAVASARRTVPLVLPDVSFTLATDRGVFARDGVDAGTRLLLLEAPPPPPAGDLLDLGCGYGPIALSLAARAPAATVWAVDVNRRARELAADNASAAGLGNVRVAAPEDVPEAVRFSAVWSNPPVRVGKRPLQALLAHWLGRLADDGSALLVVHKHLGADPLARWLEASGWPTERLRSRLGYRLLGVGPRP